MIEHVEKLFPDEYVVVGALAQALEEGVFSEDVRQYVTMNLQNRKTHILSGSMIMLTTMAAVSESDDDFESLVRGVAAEAKSDSDTERRLRTELFECCVGTLMADVPSAPIAFQPRTDLVRSVVFS